MTENLVLYWMDDDGKLSAVWIEEDETPLCDREIDAKGQE